MKKLVFFDIDGTLTRTRNGYLPFNEAIAKTFGVPGDIRSVIPDGNTDPLILEEIFAKAGANMVVGQEDWRHFTAELRESYRNSLANGTTTVGALPGVSELLRALSETEEIGRSVVTGNFETIAQVKLEAAGLNRYLARGAYGSDSRHRIDLPAIAKERWEKVTGKRVRAEQCVIVGDTPKDLEAARKNQMKCILVGTGRYPMEELAYAEPDACIADLTDTEEVVSLLRDSL